MLTSLSKKDQWASLFWEWSFIQHKSSNLLVLIFSHWNWRLITVCQIIRLPFHHRPSNDVWTNSKNSWGMLVFKNGLSFEVEKLLLWQAWCCCSYYCCCCCCWCNNNLPVFLDNRAASPQMMCQPHVEKKGAHFLFGNLFHWTFEKKHDYCFHYFLNRIIFVLCSLLYDKRCGPLPHLSML